MAQLVFQTAFPGDLLLSIPLLRRLRAWAPQDPIVLACRPGLGEFFLKEKLVDEFIAVNKSSQLERERVVAQLKQRSWNAIFCPHQSWRTQIWMQQLRAKNGRVGFRSWANVFAFEYRVKRRREWPDALRQLSLLSVFDNKLAEDLLSLPVTLLSGPVPEWASMTLRRNKLASKRICLAPGSVWPTKRWTPEGYAEVGRKLLANGFEVVLVGSLAERDLCTAIARQLPGARNMAGQTSISEMVDLFSESRALVTNDSGAMHMAAVADLPTVAVFGPTTLALGYRPWQNRAVVVQADLACRPCGKHGAKVCPVGNHRCMRDVTHGQVSAALEKFL